MKEIQNKLMLMSVFISDIDSAKFYSRFYPEKKL